MENEDEIKLYFSDIEKYGAVNAFDIALFKNGFYRLLTKAKRKNVSKLIGEENMAPSEIKK